MNIYPIGRSSESISVTAGHAYWIENVNPRRSVGDTATVTCGVADRLPVGKSMLIVVPAGASSISIVSDSRSLIRVEKVDLRDLSSYPPVLSPVIPNLFAEFDLGIGRTFQDAAGTTAANSGDPVALVTATNNPLYKLDQPGTSTRRPTLVTDEYGGQRALEFDRSDDRLLGNGILGWLNNVAGVTAYAVMKLGNSGNIEAPFAWSTTSAGSNRFAVIQAANESTNYRSRRTAADSLYTSADFIAASSAPDTPKVYAITQNFVTGALKVYIEGVEVLSATASWTAGGNSQSADSAAMFVGCDLNVASFFSGTIAYLSFARSEHSAARVGAVSRTLGWRFST